tara:strand:+ start:12160 stop:12729 length:570 start_codon:yes stop_codon:yes gene_type:complete
MSSNTDIANAALIQLGASTVENISTDTGVPATIINARFNMVKDTVLRSRNWNSATERKITTAETTAPAFGYNNQHVLPVDPWCLRVIEVYDFRSHEWNVEGRRLLIDASSIKIRYIKRIVDTEEYDPMLVEAIAAYLAYAVALKITGSRQVMNEAYARYGDVLREAARTDGLEGAPPVVTSDHFEGIRL